MLDADLFTDDDLPSWYAKAACQDLPLYLFFPERGADADDALEVCARCDVRADCLDWALATGVDDGIWGGATPQQRKRLRRESRAA